MIRNNNNYKEMLKNLNNKFGKVNAVLANEYIKVYPETAEEHRNMQKFCREEKIEFYVIRPLSERPFKIVMKGLHRDTDIEEIKSELAIALPEIEILKVGQLKNVRTKSPIDIFMIELKKNGHENKIFELTHFMFLKIKIQNYRKPPGATQCWNCNMFNHSSANCGFQTRCLKCGENHRTNQCPITTPQENPKCINCGATGHIASWRGCPLFPKIKPTKGQGVNYPKAQREFLASQYRRQENISYSMPLKINSNTDIEIAVEKFTKNLQIAHRFATKTVKKSTATYIHADIQDLIKTRNKTKKAWQTLRNPLIKTELNRIEKLIKKLDKNSRQKDQTEELEALNKEDGTLWRKAKIMRKKAQKIPALLGENGFAYSDSIKAETIAISLEKQFSLNDLSHRETENEVKKSTENFSTLPFTNNQIDNLKCIQPSEVIKVIKNLNIKKACGLDCITNKMLKNLPCTMIFEFTEIINNIFKFNYFPKAWKTAVVVPILKPGKDPTQPENYRPISLLSTLSKLTENFILDKLNEHLAENKILCPEQCGFRKSLTTTHQLLRVVEYITSRFEKGECTGAVFLDVQKAFDRVWIQGLIHKLIRYKTPPHLLQLLKSYLEERKFAVKIGNSISEAKIMRAGIPQGGKISPVLYSLYVNDIPKTHKTLLGMYADDTAILAKNKNHKYTAAALNQHLAKLDDWFLKWKIALNVNKTEAVYFAKARRKYKPIVKIKNQTITWSQQAKYLGVILD
ncbi:putative RNA-directed DNA polymerase from transposon X-element [Araneus ventricosus]|uniref:Putative RNA-directed DNA polymerase from transposon X-element n=1 Tax=Araneus ventricosus TaxID=182803 RepID=A0A4Y1ZV67_ARAVE|nr:putative RNA-directed DNA polymerase from transposon X-element [Araneus ventricosus]